MKKYVVMGYNTYGVCEEIKIHDTKAEAERTLQMCEEGDDKHAPMEYFIEEIDT